MTIWDERDENVWDIPLRALIGRWESSHKIQDSRRIFLIQGRSWRRTLACLARPTTAPLPAQPQVCPYASHATHLAAIFSDPHWLSMDPDQGTEGRQTGQSLHYCFYVFLFCIYEICIFCVLKKWDVNNFKLVKGSKTSLKQEQSAFTNCCRFHCFWMRIQVSQIKGVPMLKLLNIYQCFGSVTFLYGFGSADPCLR